MTKENYPKSAFSDEYACRFGHGLLNQMAKWGAELRKSRDGGKNNG